MKTFIKEVLSFYFFERELIVKENEQSLCTFFFIQATVQNCSLQKKKKKKLHAFGIKYTRQKILVSGKLWKKI
jgi:hypothetical protein